MSGTSIDRWALLHPVLLALLWTGLASPLTAANQARDVFPQETFVRTVGATTVYERSFDVPPWVGSPFTLSVINGSPNGQPGAIADAVASAEITVNGTLVVRRSDLNATVDRLDRTVALSPGSNQLVVRLDGAPDTYLRLRIACTIELPDLAVARGGHSATLQPDGSVLIVGGKGEADLGGAESLDGRTLQRSDVAASLGHPRSGHAASLLPGGGTLFTGGSDAVGVIATAELFEPEGERFRPLAGRLQIARSGHSSTLLPDGAVLILGGAAAAAASLQEGEAFDPNNDPLTGALYEPATGVFRLLPNALSVPRSHHSATLLPNGEVLVVGGTSAEGSLASAEIFDPASGRSTLLASSLLRGRAEHTATLRPGGSVLIAGGRDGSSLLDSMEIWDPSSGTFIAGDRVLLVARASHTATLLPIGEILIAGGLAASGPTAHTELIGPPATDDIDPEVAAVTPAAGAAGVDLNRLITLRFSEAVDGATVTAAHLRVTGSAGEVAGRWTSAEDGLYAFFSPSDLLAAGTMHTIGAAGVRDLAGNVVPSFSSSFTTVFAPSISGFDPTHGPVNTVVRVVGQHFDAAGTDRNLVRIGDTPVVVTAADASSLSFAIPPSTPVGSAKITVRTRGGSTESEAAFQVEHPVPVLESISPAEIGASAPDFTMTLAGSRFVPGAVAMFGAQSLATNVVSSSLISAQVPAAAIANGGIFPVVVVNPPPGGGSSNALPFTVVVSEGNIGDLVWHDLNEDGIQDAGEPGLAGVAVRLLDRGGAVIGTTTTAGDGTYRFSRLEAGEYAVEFVAPAGYSFSPRGVGDQEYDSDADRDTGRTAYLPLSGGQDLLVLDAGMYRAAATVATSPMHGEGDVAVTRETILRFSQPLAETAAVHEGNLYAEFGGQRLSARIHVAPDRRAATLFYNQDLPAGARIRVTLDGNSVRDANGKLVDADGDGKQGGVRHIDFDTLTLTTVPETRACGRVFASELAPGDPTRSVNVPLIGVTITVDGMETTLRTTTDSAGNFCLDPAPAGEFFVHVDGRTATNPLPPGDYYPAVGKKWKAVAGQTVSIGEVFLPRIVAGTLQPVSRTSDTVIGFPPAVLAEFPGFADVQITVPADALYSDNGSRGGMVGIAPVPPDRLPEPLPPGLVFPVVITVQTDGATNFDRPVPACFPNLPSPLTGQPLPPNSDSALWSFNHDTGSFEIVGPMTVTPDGRLVCTDPGVGILAPGWHGTQPGTDNDSEPPNEPPDDDDDSDDDDEEDEEEEEEEEEDCEEIQKRLQNDYQSKRGTGAAALSHQLSCIADRGCHDSNPIDPNNFVKNLMKDIADNRPNNPADKACEHLPPWIQMTPPPNNPLAPTSGDLCAAAGGYYHFKDELEPGFRKNCPLSDAAHDQLFNDAVVPCFDAVRNAGEISPLAAEIAKRAVPFAARRLRNKINAECANQLRAPGIYTTPAEVPPVTREDLYMPEWDMMSTLRVEAVTGEFFIPVGTSVQLRVRKDGVDLTPAASGTLYHAVVGNGSVTVSPDGLMTVLGVGSPFVDLPTPFVVVVRNGDDFGIGQFAPVDRDSNGNGLADSAERRAGLDPTAPNSTATDLDDDGISDYEEVVRGTNAAKRDTDGDGFTDDIELEFGLSPHAPFTGTLDPVRSPTYYLITRAAGVDVPIRGVTSRDGFLSNLILPPNENYRGAFYSVASGKVGYLRFSTPRSGRQQTLPRILLRKPAPLDTDGDGLPDEVEVIIGTRIDLADSDGDGVSDRAEVEQGTNPLDGTPSQTGVIQSADTPGTAVDVCAVNDLAVVADSLAGVAVFNVFNGMSPTRLAQVDTPGQARAVACAGRRVAVADGSAGLAVIDISDPPAARITHQLAFAGSAQAVIAAAGIAYVGLDSGHLLAVDLASGTVLQEILGAVAIHDLAVHGDYLLVATSSELVGYRLSAGSLELAGKIAVSGTPEGITRRRRLFAGGGVAYFTSYPGYHTIDVRNPAAMTILGKAIDSGPNSFKMIVANGSGIGVAAVGVNPRNDGTHGIWLYDVSDPAVTNRLLLQLGTTDVARAVSIYNGMAYVADSAAGLQVVNYLPFDTRGVAPTIALETNFAAGVAEEGQMFRLTAVVNDDVQVRNVQFLVDGVRVLTDGNFPFEHRFVTPLLAQQASFTIRACASDTGGNVGCTEEQTIMLTEDATPPKVTAVTPPDLGFAREGTLTTVTATFNEPVQRSSLATSTFILFSAGADGVAGTADDQPFGGGVVSYRSDLNTAFLTFSEPLPIGHYRAVISSSVADAAGNPLGADFAWTFRVNGPNSWINPNGGAWSEAGNWSDGRVPSSTDQIFITLPGTYTVVADRTATVQDLTIGGTSGTQTLWVRGASAGGHVTLTVGGNLINAGRIRIESADSSWSSRLVVQNGALTNWGTVEVNQGSGGGREIQANLINSGALLVNVTFPLAGTLTNSGTIDIAGGRKLAISNNIVNQDAGTIAGAGLLELRGVTMNYAGGTITGSAPLLISGTLNLGASDDAAAFIMSGGSTVTGTIGQSHTLWISGRGAGGHTTVTAPGGLTNAGTIRIESQESSWTSALAVPGGVLTNTGLIEFNQGSGGARSLSGAVNNRGTVRIAITTPYTGVFTNRGTVEITSGRKLTLSGAQTFQQQDGAITGPGILELNGGTFHFDGGEITGAAPLLINSALNLGSPAGQASFVMTGGSSKVSGEIGASQSLWISGRGVGGHTTATASSGLTNRGSIRIESQESSWTSALAVPGGVLTNTGLIEFNQGSGGARTLTAAVSNRGTVNIRLGTTYSGVFDNEGTLEIFSAHKLSLGSGQTLNQNDGVIRVGGTLELNAATFNFNSGEVAGNAPFLINSLLVFGPSSGAASFTMTGGNSRVGGALKENQDLWVSGRGTGGHTTLTASSVFENAGILRIESTESTFSSNFTGDLVNLPTGVVNVNQGSGGARVINGSVINRGALNFNFSGSIVGPLTNAGSLTIASGRKLSIGSGQVVDQIADSISGAGLLELNGATLNFTGGTISTPAPLLINSLLNLGPDAGQAAFIMTGGNTRVSGTLGAIQTLWINGRGLGGHTTATLLGAFVNHGTIRLESSESTFASSLTGDLLNASGGKILVNQGSGGPRNLTGTINNQGLIHAAQSAAVFGTLTNTGSIEIDSGDKLTIPSGQVLNQNAGTISIGGTLDVSSATVNFNGGVMTGTPAFLINSALNIGPAAGAGSFTMTGGSSKVSGDVQAGQSIWVNGRGSGGHTTLTAAAGFTNRGTIRLQSAESTFSSNLTVSTGTLVNAGVIEVTQGSGGARTITGNLRNEGLIQVNATTSFSATSFENAAGGIIEGRGALAPSSSTTFRNGGFINPGSSPGVLNITGTLNQLPDGALTAEIGGTTVGTQYDQLRVSAAANLDGTLHVRLFDGYDPPLGAAFDVLTYGSRSGAFATMTGLAIGNGKTFAPTYDAGKLTLTVVSE